VGTAAALAPAPAAGIAAEPNDQPVPVAVAPVKLKKDTKKSGHSGQDREKPGSSQETEIITRSLSLSELRHMRKDFSRHPGEHIVTWLMHCWDNGASSLELESKEAK